MRSVFARPANCQAPIIPKSAGGLPRGRSQTGRGPIAPSRFVTPVLSGTVPADRPSPVRPAGCPRRPSPPPAPRLRALVLNCTLKPSPAPSNTQVLIDNVAGCFEPLGVETESVRVVDLQIPHGEQLDEGDGDQFPLLLEKIRACDILIVATPVWLGERSSGRKKDCGAARRHHLSARRSQPARVLREGRAGRSPPGRGTGGQNCVAAILYNLMIAGFTTPPNADCFYTGEAGPGGAYATHGTDHHYTNERALWMAHNLAHLARVLKASPYPSGPASADRRGVQRKPPPTARPPAGVSRATRSGTLASVPPASAARRPREFVGSRLRRSVHAGSVHYGMGRAGRILAAARPDPQSPRRNAARAAPLRLPAFSSSPSSSLTPRRLRATRSPRCRGPRWSGSPRTSGGSPRTTSRAAGSRPRGSSGAADLIRRQMIDSGLAGAATDGRGTSSRSTSTSAAPPTPAKLG